MRGRARIVAAIALAANLFTPFGTLSAAAPAPPVIASIPLCPGLTVVTAVSQSNGDYESIKTIETMSATEVALKYSTERMVQDPLSNAPPHLEKPVVHRRILTADLKSANLYEQQFYGQMPDLAPGTTAIGTSTDVLNALRTKGEADIGIFIDMTGDVSVDRDTHPNVYDFQMIGHVKRIEPKDVMLPLLVNDAPALLPAIHVGGDFDGDKTEFWFLDDPANPLTLKYRYGIGSAETGDINSVLAAINGNAPARAEKDALEVTKISYRCAAATPPSAPTAQGPAGAAPAGGQVQPAAANLEQELSKTGKAEIYDIYFSFNSADIRPESEPSLKEIADVLAKHPDWKLDVAGHTDNIGGHQFNLGLSQRRAASVKAALVARYHIDPNHLTTTGYGDSRPQDTNATLEGRARNRRVELTKH